MKTFSYLVLVLAAALQGCASVADCPEGNSVAPVTLLSAQRKSGGWGRLNMGKPRGDSNAEWAMGSSWLASPAVLNRLESALLNRTWVSMNGYGLYGGKSGVGRGSQGRSWIDCTFSNGRELRVFLFREDGILEGWHSGADGISGYRLDITLAEYREIMEWSGWDELERWEAVDCPAPENDAALSRLLDHPAAVFRSSLARNSGVELASILETTRTSNKIVLRAQGETLRLLKNAVRGLRLSVLRFTMDGKIHAVERDEDPLERIVCQMSDGQTVEVHLSPSDGAWYVMGEGSFRLELSEDDKHVLLKPEGWRVSYDR